MVSKPRFQSNSLKSLGYPFQEKRISVMPTLNIKTEYDEFYTLGKDGHCELAQ